MRELHHPLVAFPHVFGIPGTGCDEHQRVEHFGIEPRGLTERFVPPVDGVGQPRFVARVLDQVLTEVRDAKGDVARFVLRGESGDRRCNRSGAYCSVNQSSERTMPSPSTESRNEAIAKSGSSTAS